MGIYWENVMDNVVYVSCSVLVRFESWWVVMWFNFEYNCLVVIDINDFGIFFWIL